MSTVRPTARPTSTPSPSPSPERGLVLLDEGNTDQYLLEPAVLPHSHGLVVLNNRAYLLDAGELVVLPLEARAQVQRLLPPGGQVGGFTVGEWIALSQSPDGDSLLILDKRGDLYRYDPASDLWSMVLVVDQRRSSPNQVPVAVTSFDGQIYLLDTAYSQVWRYADDGTGEVGYLPGDQAPWGRVGTSFDLTRGIALGSDGDLYVLLREGSSEPAGLARFRGFPAERVERFAPELALPTYLYLEPSAESTLYVIDQGGHRLQELDRVTGEQVRSYAFAGRDPEIRAVYADMGRLHLATPGAIYLYPGTGQVYSLVGGQGPDPSERADLVNDLIALCPLGLPVEGVRYLPERDSLLPGAPRIYRYGIHQGWDMYGGTMGIAIPYGTPTLAAADGVVIRADWGYREMSPAELGTRLALCDQLHRTPPEVLDDLRGRQVWVDHGNGLVTRYVHLAGIAEGVVTGTTVLRGQVVGYAGNSGTSEGVAGSQDGTHLHFELVWNGHYVGKNLSIVEVRRLLQRLFFPN